MEKSIVITGKSIDLAIAAALEQLSMDRDSVSVEVLENAKPGFLGIGACPAKVKVTYEVPGIEHKPAAALSGASRKTPKTAPRLEKPVLPEQPARREPPKQEQKPAQRQNPSKPHSNEKPRGEQMSAPKINTPVTPKPTVSYAPAAAGSTEERVEQFLKGLLEHMGSEAIPHAVRTQEDTINVELVGSDLGVLIGRRGETLDAIQHLANYSINHDADKRTRINIDAENYRGKREESLQHLAKKVAGKVVKYRRNMTLEPMNAYERHVIHATLQDVPEVATFSTGAEPNRRVVISLTKEREE